MHFLRDIIRLVVKQILAQTFKARGNIIEIVEPIIRHSLACARLSILRKTNFCIYRFFHWRWAVFLNYDRWLFCDLGIDYLNCWDDITCISSYCCKKQPKWFGPRICRTSEWTCKYTCKQRGVSKTCIVVPILLQHNFQGLLQHSWRDFCLIRIVT